MYYSSCTVSFPIHANICAEKSWKYTCPSFEQLRQIKILRSKNCFDLRIRNFLLLFVFISVRFLFFLPCHCSIYEHFLLFLFIAVCWRFTRMKTLPFFECLAHLLYILLYSMYINTYISILKVCKNRKFAN